MNRLPWRTEEQSGPHEGVPVWMAEPISGWLRASVAGSTARKDCALRLAMRFRDRFPIEVTGEGTVVWGQICQLPTNDPELALWVVDFILSELQADCGPFLSALALSDLGVDTNVSAVTLELAPKARELEDILGRSASAWMVNVDESEGTHCLERRVPAELTTMLGSTTGTPSELLRKAWHLAFGVDPAPADACLTSIRALEAALKPVVTPRHSGTLGDVIGQLRGAPQRWTFALIGRSGKATRAAPNTLETFINAIDALWPGPDRHPDGSQPEVVTADEGRAAVMTATWIISLVQQGALKRLP